MHAQGLQPRHHIAEAGLPGGDHVDTAIDACGLRSKRPSKGTRRHKAQPRQAPALSSVRNRAPIGEEAAAQAGAGRTVDLDAIATPRVACVPHAIAATPRALGIALGSPTTQTPDALDAATAPRNLTC